MSLRLDGVVLRDRGVKATLAADDGETVAIVGPNGAGKSTLLLLVAGLLTPDEGQVVIDGETVADGRRSVAPHGRSVGYLPQEASLFPHLDALANVAFGPRMQGASRHEAEAIAIGLLDRVGAAHLTRRRPSSLSGGQAQRVAIARALATEPRVLLIDEPLAAVDAASRESLRELLREQMVGRTCLVVSHDEADVAALASRVVRLDLPSGD